MNYCNIKYNDIADGEGVRTTLFVSGCTNHCEGCFQPETWDFHYGQPFTEETENEILASLDSRLIDGLTILGGEPMEPENQPAVLNLIRRVKAAYPDKTIWVYTGFYFDEALKPGQRKYTECTDEILDSIDVLVDGPFVLAKRNLALDYCGSENQRVLDIRRTRETGEITFFTR